MNIAQTVSLTSPAPGHMLAGRSLPTAFHVGANNNE